MTKTELTKYEKAILLFYLKGTLSDLSKALIFFFIFYLLGLHKELLWGIFFLTIFRTYSGGIHCKTYFRCLLVSFVVLSSGIYLGCCAFISKPIMIAIGIICCIITYTLCPVLAPTRPPLSIEEINQSKHKEGLIISIYILFLILFEPSRPINIGFWLLVLHTIQLSITYIRR